MHVHLSSAVQSVFAAFSLAFVVTVRYVHLSRPLHIESVEGINLIPHK